MVYHSFEAKIRKNRTVFEKVADEVTNFAGSFSFLVSNAIFFGAWIYINSGLLPGVSVIDPFPFILLTMIVSLEAIILSVFVLISQNRQSTIDTLREEIHLQVNEIAEREITKALQLLADLHKAQFPKSGHDPELERMLQKTDTAYLATSIEKELEKPLAIKELFEKIEEKIPIYRRSK